MLVMRDTNPACFRHALSALVLADAAQKMISDSFILCGFSLAQPPIEQLGSLINLGNAQAALYFVVVQHDAKVQLLRRQDLREGETQGEDLYNFLQESLSLFTIMAEEDPAYMRMDMMQNAGLMPVPAASGPMSQQTNSYAIPRREPDPDSLLRERQKREYEEA